jgi:hypothetical protein
MPWFKVDDNLAFHQKTLRAGNAAMGMWVRAGSECSSQLTDGFVADELVTAIGGHKLAQKLVDARLWLRVEGGYQFHQWHEDGRQPTRAQVEEERKAARLRKQQWRDKRASDSARSRGDKPGTDAGTTSGTDNGTDAVTDATVTPGVPPTPTRPDPTRPDPESLKGLLTTPSGPRKRGERLPEGWRPTPEDVAWQREHGVSDLDARRWLEKFANYWAAKTGKDATKLDWSKTWRNWLLTEQERQPRRTVNGSGSGRDPVTNQPKGVGWEFGMDQ